VIRFKLNVMFAPKIMNLVTKINRFAWKTLTINSLNPMLW